VRNILKCENECCALFSRMSDVQPLRPCSLRCFRLSGCKQSSKGVRGSEHRGAGGLAREGRPNSTTVHSHAVQAPQPLRPPVHPFGFQRDRQLTLAL
jgi:hypothetical protein